mmetsp:Transcript_8230/g.9580  ORF Transcript_8230/g.9580 Transcript_8230/m.9580 type:complete len:241 (-) Transcript_8230:1117-1839(-)
MSAGHQRRPSIGITIGDIAFHSQQTQNDNDLTTTTTTTATIATTTKFISSSERQDKSTIDFQQECKLFFELAGVTSLLSLSFVTSPLLTASYIGRNFAPVYLSAFTIANLTGNLSTFALLAGLMTASDTLSPQAYGKKEYDEIGKIAIRGFCVCNLLLVPVNVVLFFLFGDNHDTLFGTRCGSIQTCSSMVSNILFWITFCNIFQCDMEIFIRTTYPQAIDCSSNILNRDSIAHQSYVLY